MNRIEVNENPSNAPLTPTMRGALEAAADRWDRSVLVRNRRTRWALFDRGMVDIVRGISTDRHGHRIYDAIVDVKINAAGFAAIGASPLPPR